MTIPLLTSYSAAVSFIDEIEEKIVKVMAKQNEKMSKKMVEITPDTVIKTVCREISFKPSDRAEIKVVLYNNAAIIEYPINADLSELEPFLKEAVIKILRHEAKEFLPKRLKELADKHGFTYNDRLCIFPIQILHCIPRFINLRSYQLPHFIHFFAKTD